MPQGYEGAPAIEAPKGLDFFDIQEAMTMRWRVQVAEIRTWSWRFFCAKWARLIKLAREDADRREEQGQG